MALTKQSEVQGIVIRAYDFGETDQIIVLHTCDRGLIRSVAKGIRRPGSRFGGRLQLHCLSTVQLYAGRNMDLIQEVDLITANEGIRKNWITHVCASVVAEAIGGVVQEEAPNIPLFSLHRTVLEIMHSQPSNPIALMSAFLFRLSHLEGYTPAVSQCGMCGSPDIAGFCVPKGGVTCTTHTVEQFTRISPELHAYLQVLASSPLEDVANIDIPTSLRTDGRRRVERWFGQQLKLKLATLESLP